MTAHVAEARENSGRVLVWLEPSERTSVSAFSAATRLAAAFGAFVETVVIGDHDFEDVQDIPLGRVSYGARAPIEASGQQWPVTIFSMTARRLQRLVADAAARSGVTVRHSNAFGDAIDQVDNMCRQHGPWNIVVLARAPGVEIGETVSSILANVGGATGVLVAGRNAEPTSDDVIVVIEDLERLPSFLRAGERLRRGKGKIRLLLVAELRSQLESLEEAARLAVAGRNEFSFELPLVTLARDDTANQSLIKERVAFVIARFGGAFLPRGRGFERLTALTGSPFLLVR